MGTVQAQQLGVAGRGAAPLGGRRGGAGAGAAHAHRVGPAALRHRDPGAGHRAQPRHRSVRTTLSVGAAT